MEGRRNILLSEEISHDFEHIEIRETQRVGARAARRLHVVACRDRGSSGRVRGRSLSSVTVSRAIAVRIELRAARLQSRLVGALPLLRRPAARRQMERCLLLRLRSRGRHDRPARALGGRRSVWVRRVPSRAASRAAGSRVLVRLPLRYSLVACRRGATAPRIVALLPRAGRGGSGRSGRGRVCGGGGGVGEGW